MFTKFTVGAIADLGRIGQQLASGGGFSLSNLFNTAAGIVSVIPGVGTAAGAAIRGGAQILSGAFSGSDDINPSPVRIVSYSDDALAQRERGRGGPESVTIQIIRSDTGFSRRSTTSTARQHGTPS